MPAVELPDVFSYSEAVRLGISDRRLYAMRDSGQIEQLGRGLFRRTDSAGDPDLLEIAARAPEATLCLTSALARHGLTDEIPSLFDIALPRTRRQPAVGAPVRWHRFDPGTFALGRSQVDVDGASIGLYSEERSICDAFRLRHREGSDQAVEALKRWLRRRSSQPAALLRVAHRLGPRAETPIRDALEFLL